MALTEREYGVREPGEERYGAFTAKIERALEVINSLEGVRVYAEWEGPDRVTVMGRGDEEFDFYLTSFDGDSLTIPWSLSMIIGNIAEATVSIMAEDAAIYNKKFLLGRARSMEEERAVREMLLDRINHSFNTIFFDEESRRGAEDRVLSAWSKAVGEKGFVVTEEQMRRLTKNLPMLGRGEVLIYHVSASLSPRYYRVYYRGGDVALEKIEAFNMVEIVRGAPIVPVEELENEELRIVETVLRGMCPGIESE
jgi:hypothetical protein